MDKNFELWWEQLCPSQDYPLSKQLAYDAWRAGRREAAWDYAKADDNLALLRLNATDRVLAALSARLDALEKQHHPDLADPDPCAGGFCPVELFRPIEDTEGSV